MGGKRHESRLHVVLGAIALSCLLSCAAAAGTASLVGKPAPALAGVDLHQQPIDLAALRGQRVLLMFWATWSSPCRKEMPLVKSAFASCLKIDLQFRKTHFAKRAGQRAWAQATLQQHEALLGGPLMTCTYIASNASNPLS